MALTMHRNFALDFDDITMIRVFEGTAFLTVRGQEGEIVLSPSQTAVLNEMLGLMTNRKGEDDGKVTGQSEEPGKASDKQEIPDDSGSDSPA